MKKTYTKKPPELERQIEFVRECIKETYPELAHLVYLVLEIDSYTWMLINHYGMKNSPTPKYEEEEELCKNHADTRDLFLNRENPIPYGDFFWAVRNATVNKLAGRKIKWLPEKVYTEMVDYGFLPHRITYEDGTTVLYQANDSQRDRDDVTEPVKIIKSKF